MWNLILHQPEYSVKTATYHFLRYPLCRFSLDHTRYNMYTYIYIYMYIYIVYINILYIHRFPRNILHSHFFETFTWLQPCSENLRNGRRWVRCGCSVVGHNNSCHNVAHGSQYRLKRTRGESLRVFQTPKKTGIIVYRGILFFWEPLIFFGGKSNFDANIVLLVILRDFPVPLNRGQSLGW